MNATWGRAFGLLWMMRPPPPASEGAKPSWATATRLGCCRDSRRQSRARYRSAQNRKCPALVFSGDAPGGSLTLRRVGLLDFVRAAERSLPRSTLHAYARDDALIQPARAEEMAALLACDVRRWAAIVFGVGDNIGREGDLQWWTLHIRRMPYEEQKVDGSGKVAPRLRRVGGCRHDHSGPAIAFCAH